MAAAKKPASLADRIVYARNVGQELGDATDKLNASILNLERRFAELRLGVECHLSLTSAEEAEDGYFTDLWFEKNGSEWKFIVRSGNSHEDIVDSTMPLVKASKAVRLHAASRMKELLEALIVKAEDQVSEVLSTASDLDDLASSLDAARKKADGEQIYVPTAQAVYVGGAKS